MPTSLHDHATQVLEAQRAGDYILWLDDEPKSHSRTMRDLQGVSAEAKTITNIPEAVAWVSTLTRGRLVCVVLDLIFESDTGAGVSFLRHLRDPLNHQVRYTPVVISTMMPKYAVRQVAAECERLGIFAWVKKDEANASEELAAAIREAVSLAPEPGSEILDQVLAQVLSVEGSNCTVQIERDGIAITRDIPLELVPAEAGYEGGAFLLRSLSRRGGPRPVYQFDCVSLDSPEARQRHAALLRELADD